MPNHENGKADSSRRADWKSRQPLAISRKSPTMLHSGLIVGIVFAWGHQTVG